MGIFASNNCTVTRGIIKYLQVYSTFITNKSSFSIDVKFIIGDSACGLHVRDRLDQFSCQPWYASAAG